MQWYSYDGKDSALIGLNAWLFFPWYEIRFEQPDIQPNCRQKEDDHDPIREGVGGPGTAWNRAEAEDNCPGDEGCQGDHAQAAI